MEDVLLLTSKMRDLQTRICIEHLLSAMAGRAGEFAGNFESWPHRLHHLGQVRRRCRDVRVIHAWGFDALKLASFTAGAPIVYTPLAGDPPNTARWLAVLQSRRDLNVVSLSAGDDRWLVSSGVQADRCNLIRPGIRMPRDLSRDLSLRKGLGLSDDHIAVLAVGESEDYSDHPMAYHTMSILHQIDSRYVMIVWGHGSKADSLLRRQQLWKSDFMVNVADVDPQASHEQVIRACDLALITSPGRFPLVPVLQCMAGNLPLVAPATRETSEVLEDRHTGFLYSPLAPRVASQRVLAAAEDPHLSRQLADQARAECYELFPVSTFVSQMQDLYQRVGHSSGK